MFLGCSVVTLSFSLSQEARLRRRCFKKKKPRRRKPTWASKARPLVGFRSERQRESKNKYMLKKCLTISQTPPYLLPNKPPLEFRGAGGDFFRHDTGNHATAHQRPALQRGAHSLTAPRA
ncbi:hypothetical protein MPTK1_7g18578 [Marchantia polymorpha subsp. ruderalis]